MKPARDYSGLVYWFVKLAQVGGPTPDPSLATDNGMIYVGGLNINHEFKAMIEKGGHGQRRLHLLTMSSPTLQTTTKALNVNNHVAQKTSELAMALSMTELVSDPSIYEGEASWNNLVIEHMKNRGIPSGAYADIILEFALQYGGGNDGSRVKFMHDVACHFGCHYVLGETVWTAMTETAFAYTPQNVAIAESCTLSLQSVCSTSSGWHCQVAVEN